jgi:hypothetical protein
MNEEDGAHAKAVAVGALDAVAARAGRDALGRSDVSTTIYATHDVALIDSGQFGQANTNYWNSDDPVGCNFFGGPYVLLLLRRDALVFPSACRHRRSHGHQTLRSRCGRSPLV